jgi:hypothetical protein
MTGNRTKSTHSADTMRMLVPSSRKHNKKKTWACPPIPDLNSGDRGAIQ